MPVGAIPAPPGRGVRPRGVRGVAEQEIGERVAGAGRRRRVLRHHAGESVGAVVIARVGEQDVPVVDPAAELQDVPPLHPRHVVGDLPLAAVLPLRPAVAGVPGEARVAGEGERRQARDRGILGLLQSLHARLRQQIGALPLEVRRRSILAVHPADPQLVNERRSRSSTSTRRRG